MIYKKDGNYVKNALCICKTTKVSYEKWTPVNYQDDLKK